MAKGYHDQADFLAFLESEKVPAIDLQSPSNAPVPVIHFFVPEDAVKHHLSEVVVQKLLRSCDVSTLPWKRIRQHFSLVFTILIVIGKGKYIEQFIHHNGLGDDQLPFAENKKREWPVECQSFFKEFFDAQWRFCAVKLSEQSSNNTRYPGELILPITSRDVLKEGPDSSIYKVEIHPAYNFLTRPNPNSSKPATNTFVLKTCRAAHSQLHHNEVTAYNIINFEEYHLQNTVRFYGSWEHRQTYSMLVEYIDGGTLEEFFFSNQPPVKEEDIIMFWERLLDITRPVSRVHKHPDPEHPSRFVRGMHNDIKTTNILVTKARGHSKFDVTFKLADWGLSHFAPTPRGGQGGVKDTGGTQIFAPPECFRDERYSGQQREILDAKPSKDIWSLGCVLSEAAVWSVGGTDSLDEYRQKRRAATSQIPELRKSAYSGCFHNTETVLEVVLEMHGEARKSKRQNDNVVHDMISIIENMLGEERERPQAMQIFKNCQKILQRARCTSNPKQKKPEEELFPKAFQTSQMLAGTPQMPPETPPDLEGHYGLGLGVEPGPSQRYGSSNSHTSLRPPPGGSNLTRSYTEDQIRIGYNTGVQVSPPQNPRYPGRYSGQIINHKRTPSLQGILQNRHFSDPVHSPYRGSLSKNNITSHEDHGIIFQEPESSKPGDNELLNKRMRSPTLESHRPETLSTLPTISISEVNEWIRRGRREKRKGDPLRGTEELRRLDNRDQIFLFDDSASMRPHWSDVKEAFAALAYLVKDKDPDGIEIYFTSNPTKKARCKHRKPLLERLDNTSLEGHCDIGLTLGKVLRELGPEGSKTLFSRLGIRRNKKYGVNIYVLTDGVWQDGLDWLDGIVEPIKNLIARGMKKNQLGIQFIQFGTSPEGTQRLKVLDDELREHDVTVDFIDTEHRTGNVYKMLLGAIDPRWDRGGSRKSVIGTMSPTRQVFPNSPYWEESPTTHKYQWG